MIDKSPSKNTWLWVSRIIALLFLGSSGYMLYMGDEFGVVLFIFFLAAFNESWKPTLSARLLKRFKKNDKKSELGKKGEEFYKRLKDAPFNNDIAGQSFIRKVSKKK